MWIRGSAAPPPEGRRRAPGVYTARGGGVRDPRSWSRRGRCALANPGALAPEAGPGGRATSCGSGFPGPRSEVGRSWDHGLPRVPPPPAVPLPGGGLRGVGKRQLGGPSLRVAASPRRCGRLESGARGHIIFPIEVSVRLRRPRVEVVTPWRLQPSSPGAGPRVRCSAFGEMRVGGAPGKASRFIASVS